MKPNFSVVCIAKNEERTLPRLVNSLKEFQNRGGEIIILDTGSLDNTVEVAEKLGCKVYAVGTKFLCTIDKELADKVNKHFLADDEPDILKEDDKYFDFAASRNYAASLASNDWIFTPDCDEVLTTLNLDEIEKVISDPNVDRAEYQFVFSHDQFNNPVIQFMHSKFYRKSKMKWCGVIHEILQPI